MGRFKCDSCGVYVMTTYKGGLCEECYDNVKEIEKMIKTKEESKVDELKVYTGKETIEALLEGKTLINKESKVRYKIENHKLVSDVEDGDGFIESFLYANKFIFDEFTEVVLPQVGDWVKAVYKGYLDTYTHTAQITELEGDLMWADWEGNGSITYYKLGNENVSWEILSPEQITEYKREQAFSKVGRKLNEFREGDIVMIDSLGVTAIVVSKKNDPKVQLHGINQVGKGHVAQPHQLTPIFFAESQVDLS